MTYIDCLFEDIPINWIILGICLFFIIVLLLKQWKISDINDDLQIATKKIASLENNNSSLHQELQNKTEKIASLESNNSSLRQEMQDTSTQITSLKQELKDSSTQITSLNVINLDLKQRLEKSKAEYAKSQISFLEMSHSLQTEFDKEFPNPTEKFSYMATLMADHLTLKYENYINTLKQSKKYHERQRAVKIKEVREETKTLLSKYKEAQYQLELLIQAYPELMDFLDDNSLFQLSFSDIKENAERYSDSPASNYLSREEWDMLSESERNQLALDRYLSREKTNWEIGRDYELYIAHCYEKEGYEVDTYGSYMRINDLGRDLIVKFGNTIKIIQCKYWSAKKEIHENHICQLYGTVICYCIENHLTTNDVEAVFVTSTKLSQKANQFAKMLKIKVYENIPLKEFPRIKCNVGHDEFGCVTHIYHLPMDPLYDKVKITKANEYYCTTVAEAESLGFRHAYKWHGN